MEMENGLWVYVAFLGFIVFCFTWLVKRRSKLKRQKMKEAADIEAAKKRGTWKTQIVEV